MPTDASTPGSGPPAGRALRMLWASRGVWRPRALVAEDDPDLRRLIVEALHREGFVVSEARDGRELLEIVNATCIEEGSAPELVVADVRMPGCSGIEALQALRASLRGSAILVITAFGDEAVRRAAREAGAVGVLDKPFELDELRAAVAGLVK